MARIEGLEAELQAALATAALIAAGARTAPKTRGVDSLKTLILNGEDLGVLAAAMEAKTDQKVKKHSNFSRNASNVRASAAVVLFGVTGEPKKPETPLTVALAAIRGVMLSLPRARRRGKISRSSLYLPTHRFRYCAWSCGQIGGEVYRQSHHVHDWPGRPTGGISQRV